MTQDKIEPPDRPLTGLFANLRAADRAARGLIALGQTEDQIEILDLTRLIAEFNPEFAKKVGIGTASPHQIDVDAEAIEGLALGLADAVDLPLYLVNMGVPESAATYYASEIRDGFVLLVTRPGQHQASEAMRLLDEAGIRYPSVRLVNTQEPES